MDSPNDLSPSPETYNLYDRFFTSALYYMSSKARETDGIIIETYNPNFSIHNLGVQLALNYGVLKAKKIYLKCSLFDFLEARKKFGGVVHWYPMRSRKSTYCILDPYTMASDICGYEDIPMSVVLDGYRAYYGKEDVHCNVYHFH